MLTRFHHEHPGAAAALAGAGTLLRVNLLSLIADRLECNSANLMVAGGQDLQAGRREGLNEQQLAHLKLDAGSIRAACAGLRQAAERMSRAPEAGQKGNGEHSVVLLMGNAHTLQFAEAASLCLAAGRVCLLAGNPLAKHSNVFIGGVVRGALLDLELPEHALMWLENLEGLEDGDFNAINEQLGLVIWLGREAPESSLMDRISIPLVHLEAASELPEALEHQAQEEQEE